MNLLPVRFAIPVVAACLLAGCPRGGTATVSPTDRRRSPSSPPPALVDALRLSPFYTKYIDVGGLPVLAGDRVADAAILEAAFLIDKMIGHRPEVLRAIADREVRVAVMATTELTTDIPEHSDLEPKAYWDRRARGLGATAERPATSCGEENLLHLAGDPYSTENILIHELAHTIHEFGMRAIDPTFQQRLDAAYQHARDAGLWASTYAMENVAEYWAEASQSWFDTNRVNDDDHGAVATRDQLIVYDPDVAALLAEVYGAGAWRYRRIEDRAADEVAHLAGFDRSTAARFAWPASTIMPSLALLPTRPGASPPNNDATYIVFANHRSRDVSVSWIDFDGNLVPYATVRPGTNHIIATFIGHAWVIVDADGTVLGYAAATASAGQVEIR